jgi:hypothetical protein
MTNRLGKISVRIADSILTIRCSLSSRGMAGRYGFGVNSGICIQGNGKNDALANVKTASLAIRIRQNFFSEKLFE